MKFLFDLGGVFFDWNPRYFYKNVFNKSEELDYFLNEICTNEWNIQQDAGRLIKVAEEELISIFPSYSKEIKMYYLNHRKMIKEIYHESVNILDNLKNKNISSFVLSNWSAETFKGMTDDYPFLKKFDGIIISGEVKLVKPDKKIFQLAIEKYDLNPSETVFIDDNLDNIEAAVNLGFLTVHLKDPHLIKKEINKFIN